MEDDLTLLSVPAELRYSSVEDPLNPTRIKNITISGGVIGSPGMCSGTVMGMERRGAMRERTV